MSEVVGGRPVAFVTGGSGFVGGALIRALVARGWEVRALARSAGAMAAVGDLGAVPIKGDLTERASLERGTAGASAAFHIAAMFKMWGPRKEFDRVNVGGMQAVVDAAAASAVRKVIAVSAAAVVMGDPESMLAVDESAPLQIRSFAPYASSKAKAERVLLKATGRRPGFETIAIRPPMIWGAGMPMLDVMAAAVKAGNWQWVDGGAQAMSTCHRDNLVDALLLAAEKGKGGQAYFVADAEEGTLKSVLGDLLATQQIKAADKSISFGMAWTLAGIMGVAWRLFRLKGEPPITRQLLRLIGKPFTVRTEKARRELGFIPRVTWRDGIAEMTSSRA